MAHMSIGTSSPTGPASDLWSVFVIIFINGALQLECPKSGKLWLQPILGKFAVDSEI